MMVPSTIETFQSPDEDSFAPKDQALNAIVQMMQQVSVP